MQKKYTAKAKKALVMAESIAKSLEHNYVGTEHLLIGLISEPNGTAAQVMHIEGIDKNKMLKLIEELIAPTGKATLLEQGGYTPRTIKALELSLIHI